MIRYLPCLLLFAAGCSGRMITSVENGYGPVETRTVILSTLETKSFIVAGQTRQVWWECAEKTDGLHCKRTCDVKDDEGDLLTCQKLTTF